MEYNKGFYHLSIKDKITNDKIVSIDEYFKSKYRIIKHL